MLFGPSNISSKFSLFSESHLTILILFILIIGSIFHYRFKLREDKWRKAEIGVAVSLILFELIYHLWMIENGTWKIGRSLPLELCNIGLILCVLLLLTGKKIFFEMLFFIALFGATQAILTPALTYNFPHFRFFHFFYTHMMVVWVVLFFMWVKGYYPTFMSVIKVIVFLNLLLPVILYVNNRNNGNYWFLRHKPDSPSLFDLLGPYPWYIFTLEGLLLLLSFGVWLIFRRGEPVRDRPPVSD
ncbi:TIGR02206 family membrane protein [Lysinibacillus yapensis]|uniref:TIGR02206 family membrane protein n=1 Tax=Ureibacillus yapensis TaxID=2304605 RepID=A0A396SCL7_9BACL|nr:TIGR02206 family membrane protein [Lysinibacillus yapensis]RHW39356.1 TIGR02206 family membrane protein [Lysinibacillus yapensis]